MASVASNCIYKSVTLAVGETFTIPPGAELVSASGGLESFTSTCPKLTSIETPIVYEFKWAGTQDTNDATKMFESEAPDYNNFMNGIIVNNIYYSFSGRIQSMSSDTDLQSRFNSTIFNGVIYNASRIFYDYDETSKSRGMGAIYRFTTIPSIGDNLEIIFSTGFVSDRFGQLSGTSFEYRTKPYRV
jgi:hypothetical protein